MKYAVRRFKSLKVALKELEPFIRDGRHLQSGKAFARFGDLRSREILANWLVSAVTSHALSGDFYFTTDPTGGDGVICDAGSEDTWPTEHVMVPELENPNAPALEDRVLGQVALKVNKGGAAYARGKTLVVFLNAGEGAQWFPNRVLHRLPSPLHFDTVWTVGLQAVVDGVYVYGVANLEPSPSGAAIFQVTISPDFESWTVHRVQ